MTPSRRTLLSVLLATAMAPVRAFAQARPQKEVLAFYYGWYGTKAWSGADTHWTAPDPANKRIADSPEYPVGGPYDSLDPAVIARHVAKARDAGITGLIASWWTQGDRTDRQLPLLLDAASAVGLKVAAYLENAETPEALAHDILHLYHTHGRHPAWLRLNGKAVFFVYDRPVQTLGFDGWQKARALVEAEIPGAMAFVGPAAGRKQMQARKSAFDGFHIYAMPYELKQPHRFESLWRRQYYKGWVDMQKDFGVVTATVIPGYDERLVPDRPAPTVIDRENGRLFRQLWAGAIAAKPDWILVVSFNEWHEASQIEPSTAFGTRELDTCRQMSAKFKG